MFSVAGEFYIRLVQCLIMKMNSWWVNLVGSPAFSGERKIGQNFFTGKVSFKLISCTCCPIKIVITDTKKIVRKILLRTNVRKHLQNHFSKVPLNPSANILPPPESKMWPHLWFLSHNSPTTHFLEKCLIQKWFSIKLSTTFVQFNILFLLYQRNGDRHFFTVYENFLDYWYISFPHKRE